MNVESEVKWRANPASSEYLKTRADARMPKAGWGVIEHVEGTSQMPYQSVRQIYDEELTGSEERARARAEQLNDSEGVMDLPDGGDIPDRHVFFTAAYLERESAFAEISLHGIYRATVPDQPSAS